MTVAAFDLLIRGGVVLDVDAGKSRRVDVATRGGRIVAVAPAIDSRAKRVIDARNLWVSPLLVDLTRDPPPADDAAAALFGFVAESDGTPAPAAVVDSPNAAVHARFLPRLATDDDAPLPDLRALCAAENIAGAAGGGWDSRRAARLFELAATFSILLVCEARDRSLAAGTAVCAGARNARLGLPMLHSAAEEIEIFRLSALARECGARLHFAKLSTARGVAAFLRARDDGADVSADASARGLLLTDDDGGDFDLRRRLWPPLGGDDDRAALTAAAAAGDIAIRSDHCAPPPGRASFVESPPGGAGGAAILLGATLAWARQRRIAPARALSLITIVPAARFGFALPRLAVGETADFCLIDPRPQWRATNFADAPLRGKIAAVARAGKIAR